MIKKDFMGDFYLPGVLESRFSGESRRFTSLLLSETTDSGFAFALLPFFLIVFYLKIFKIKLNEPIDTFLTSI